MNLLRATVSLSVLTALSSCTAAEPASAGDAVLAIGAVQGRVSDQAAGLKHKSPRNKEEVTVQGVVTSRLLWTSRKGNVHHAFTLQNTREEADADPQTSDAIFVYTEKTPALAMGRENVEPRVGDHLVVRGVVEEYFGQTQLKSPVLVRKLGGDADLDKSVPSVELNPPFEESRGPVYWERLECMRVHLPAGAVATSPRRMNDRNGDGEIVVIRGDHPVARRTDPATRRVYRDPHPLDDDATKAFDNGNGFRIFLDSLALKGETNNPATLVPPVRTTDGIRNALHGVVLHGEGGYKFATRDLPEIDPSAARFPDIVVKAGAARVATYNVENLFDFRNDPFDDSDFEGDSGTGNAVAGVFDYVPADEKAYLAKVRQIALQITVELKSPDILMIQEAEDQDICVVQNGKLVNKGVNNADGKLDVLQELALDIVAQGGPEYVPVSDRDGADPRGITCAFLYRADRVRLAAPDRNPPLFGKTPGVTFGSELLPICADVSNPKVFNARYTIQDKEDNDPEVLFARGTMAAHFDVFPKGVGQGTPFELFLLNNHFASRPDRKIIRRTTQARLVAACARALLEQKPGALFLAGGDFNVYARPDDPVPEAPSDQLRALYELGLTNAYDAILAREPVWAYSYVHDGMAGILDQMYLSPELNKRVLHAQYLHLNSDWSEPAVKPFHVRASDHDPLMINIRAD